MAEWIDQKDGEGQIIEASRRVGVFEIVIYRQYLRASGNHYRWRTTCHGLFGGLLLNARDPTEAKIQALAKMHVMLDDAIADM